MFCPPCAKFCSGAFQAGKNHRMVFLSWNSSGTNWSVDEFVQPRMLAKQLQHLGVTTSGPTRAEP